VNCPGRTVRFPCSEAGKATEGLASHWPSVKDCDVGLYWLRGLRKGDEHPALTLTRTMTLFLSDERLLQGPNNVFGAHRRPQCGWYHLFMGHQCEYAGTRLSISDARLEIDTAGVELMLSYDNPIRRLPEWKDNTTGLQRRYCTLRRRRRRVRITSTSPFRTQWFTLRLCDWINKLGDGHLAPVAQYRLFPDLCAPCCLHGTLCVFC